MKRCEDCVGGDIWVVSWSSHPVSVEKWREGAIEGGWGEQEQELLLAEGQGEGK